MDVSSLLIGVVLGVIGAFGTGFLKKAGEDLYTWIKRKINPKSVPEPIPQVVMHLHNSNVDKQEENTSPIHITPSKIERMNQVSFDDIEKAIDNAPPLQRDNVANNFVGLKIEWDSYLRSASQMDDGNIRLRLAIDKDYRGRSIVCEVPAEKYRELGILPQGAHIRVSGEITSASSCDVELSDVRLQIFSSSKAT